MGIIANQMGIISLKFFLFTVISHCFCLFPFVVLTFFVIFLDISLFILQYLYNFRSPFALGVHVAEGFVFSAVLVGSVGCLCVSHGMNLL